MHRRRLSPRANAILQSNDLSRVSQQNVCWAQLYFPNFHQQISSFVPSVSTCLVQPSVLGQRANFEKKNHSTNEHSILAQHLVHSTRGLTTRFRVAFTGWVVLRLMN